MKTYAKFERRDPAPQIPFDEDSFTIDLDIMLEVFGWILLGACFLGVVVGFLAMPEVV